VSDMPAKIWAWWTDSDGPPPNADFGEWYDAAKMPREDAERDSVAYIRADLVEELKEAAEARVAYDDDVAAKRCVSRKRGQEVRSNLRAALAKLK